jgi:2-phosphosulfolactate phosphatase
MVEGRQLHSDQSPFAVRFEWGERGLESLGPDSGVIVIVDVRSFCTCAEVATARGAAIFPYRWRDDTVVPYAEERGASVADGHRRADRYSLSPTSLAGIPPATCLVLPSPNGAHLSLRAGAMATTVAACLRNAAAVAGFARSQGDAATIIACGERWPDGSLRQRVPVVAFVNNHFEGYAPETARRLVALTDTVTSA